MMGYQTFTSELTLNLTEESDASLYTYSYAERVIITVIYPLILAIGLFGNVGVFFVVARVRRMQSVINVYLVDLGAAGILQLIVGASTPIARYNASPVFNDSINFGSAGCVAVFFLQDITTWAAFSFAAIVTLILYSAVCRPHRFRRFRSKKRAVKVSAVNWVACACASLCFLPIFSRFVKYSLLWPDTEEYDSYPDVMGVCSPEAEWLLITHDLLVPSIFFIGFINNTVIFTAVLRTLRLQLTSVMPSQVGPIGDIAKQKNRAQTKRDNSRIGITRMLLVTSLVFFLLPMPFQCALFSRSVAKLTGNYILNDEQYRNMMFYSTAIMNLTPAICPYLYILLNRNYRRATVEAFTVGCLKKSNRLTIRTGEMSTFAQ